MGYVLSRYSDEVLTTQLTLESLSWPKADAVDQPDTKTDKSGMDLDAAGQLRTRTPGSYESSRENQQSGRVTAHVV